MDYITKEFAEILDNFLSIGVENQSVSSSFFGFNEFRKNQNNLRFLEKREYIKLYVDFYNITVEGEFFYKQGGFSKQYAIQKEREELQKVQTELTQKQIKNIKYYKVTTVISLLISFTAVAISLFK